MDYISNAVKAQIAMFDTSVPPLPNQADSTPTIEQLFNEAWKELDAPGRIRLLTQIGEKDRQYLYDQAPDEGKEELIKFINDTNRERIEAKAKTVNKVLEVAADWVTHKIVLMAAIDYYSNKVIKKIENYNLAKKMKFKIPRPLREFKKYASKCMADTYYNEKTCIGEMICMDMPYYESEYEDYGTFVRDLQTLAWNKLSKTIHNFYMKCHKVAERDCPEYCDLLACLYVVYLLGQALDAKSIVADMEANNVMRKHYNYEKKHLQTIGISTKDYVDKTRFQSSLVLSLILYSENIIEALTGTMVKADSLNCMNKEIKSFVELDEIRQWGKEIREITHRSMDAYISWYFAKMVKNDMQGFKQPQGVKDDILLVMNGKPFEWCRTIRDIKSLSRLINNPDMDYYDIEDKIEELKDKDGIKTPLLDTVRDRMHKLYNGELERPDYEGKILASQFIKPIVKTA